MKEMDDEYKQSWVAIPNYALLEQRAYTREFLGGKVLGLG